MTRTVSSTSSTDQSVPVAPPDRSPRWRRLLGRAIALIVSTVLAVSMAGLTWAGGRLPANQSIPVTAADVPAPAGEAVYSCHAAPNNTLGAVSVGETTSTTTLTSLDERSSLAYKGESLTKPVTSLTEATGGMLTVDPNGEKPIGAVGVTTTLSADGDLRGLAAAPCTPPEAISWIVGGSTALGSSAELRLTNPGTTSVTATIHLYGSVGEISLPSDGQVVVPPGKTMGVLLEAAGTDPRLALSLEAVGGTLVPALVTESLDGETAAGTEVLTGGAAPATDLTIPGVALVDAADQGETAPDAAAGAPDSSDAPAVRLVNPGSETATVSISMIGSDGEQSLPGADSVAVDPGAVFDVSLSGVPAGEYGVRVSSDSPVAAGVRLVRSAGEYPERSGALLHDVAWLQAATPAAGEAGSIALPRGEGLTSSLVLTNSGQEPAAVTLASADGAWTQEVDVPAGSTVTPEVPAEVTAAAVVTAKVSGNAAGTLIAAVPAVADSTALAESHLLLH